MEETRCQVENLQRELEQSKNQNRMIQTRLDETEKEGTELSAECDELARQLNTEKETVRLKCSPLLELKHVKELLMVLLFRIVDFFVSNTILVCCYR